MTEKDYQKAIVTISKDTLANLPSQSYEGKIHIIDKPEKVVSAVRELRAADIIGFDTETRPSFRKGQNYNVALIQLATPECCFLFRTNIIGYPVELIELLEDPQVTKIGLSLHDDFHNIRKLVDINPQGFIDLQCYVKQFKIADNSLSRLYGILFDKRISKGQRLSNWESPTLTSAQQDYAALDALACIHIFQFLEKGLFNPKESKYLTIPSEPETKESLGEETEKDED